MKLIRNKETAGFTLIDILSAMAIVAILTAFVIPTFAAVLDAAAKRTFVNTALGLLNFARDQAVSHSSHVVICPSEAGHCAEDWTKPWMVFVDHNRNNEHDEEQKILNIRNLIDNKESISWKSFGSKPYISFDEHGTTGFQSGRIYFCDDKTSPDLRAQIIVYRTGRSRIARSDEYREGC